MSLIQQCCWVSPKQKAWLRSPPLMLGKSCSHKLPQQPLARSAPSRNTDGQQPGCGLYASMRMFKPTSKKTPFLSLSHLQPTSQLSEVPFHRDSGSVPDVAFLEQMAGETWPVANCFLLMKHTVRGGEGPSLQPEGKGRARLCSPVPWTRGHLAYVQRKICSFKQRFLAISLNWTSKNSNYEQNLAWWEKKKKKKRSIYLWGRIWIYLN